MEFSHRVGINGIEYLKPREPGSDADDGTQHLGRENSSRPSRAE